MVEYNPADSSQLHPESSKTFGGVKLSFEEWEETIINYDALSYSIEDIFHSEDAEYYSLNDNKTRYTEAPTQIVLLNTGDFIIPFYLEEYNQNIIYRGREDFSKITREDGDEIKLTSTNSTFDSKEVPRERYTHPAYELYNMLDDFETNGYISLDPKYSVIEVDGNYYSSSEVYWASDQYLVELFNINDLYLEKTV